jgi:NADPH:quinone reductase
VCPDRAERCPPCVPLSSRFGDANLLTIATVPTPDPGPGKVAIDVAFVGANYAEILYRRGVVDVPVPFVPGIKAAGAMLVLDQVAGLRRDEWVLVHAAAGGIGPPAGPAWSCSPSAAGWS